MAESHTAPSFSEDTFKKSVDWFSQHCYQETPEVQAQAQIFNIRDICIILLDLSSKVSPVLSRGETLDTEMTSSHINYPVILPTEQSSAFVQDSIINQLLTV